MHVNCYFKIGKRKIKNQFKNPIIVQFNEKKFGR